MGWFNNDKKEELEEKIESAQNQVARAYGSDDDDALDLARSKLESAQQEYSQFISDYESNSGQKRK